MRREFSLKDVYVPRFNEVLSRLGYIYATTQGGDTRYNLGGFMTAITNAEIAITEEGDHAYLRIELGPRGSENSS